ncbi:MAG: hypothetical protein PHQ75_11340 [Thermoguttaceae bacterium]|nr:hypothetical protein [Thermoguttaceae bacterium]
MVPLPRRLFIPDCPNLDILTVNGYLASCIMALIVNCHRDSKTKPFKPEQFNPLVQKTVGAQWRSCDERKRRSLQEYVPETHRKNSNSLKGVMMILAIVITPSYKCLTRLFEAGISK